MNSVLVLVSGPPGIGKSTLSGRLARQWSAVHLDKDAIDEAFSPGVRDDDYTKNIEPRILVALLNLAELNLRAGHRVLLDVPWTHIMINTPQWVDQIKGLCLRTGASWVVLELVLGPSVLKERLERRGFDRDRPRLTPEGWAKFSKTDCLDQVNPMPHFQIDASMSPQECFAEALKALEKHLAGGGF